MRVEGLGFKVFSISGFRVALGWKLQGFRVPGLSPET